MNTREQHAGERDLEADRREQLADLYRGAVTSSVAGAVEVSRWVRADAHAHLQRRHELLARDGSALDRYDDADVATSSTRSASRKRWTGRHRSDQPYGPDPRLPGEMGR